MVTTYYKDSIQSNNRTSATINSQWQLLPENITTCDTSVSSKCNVDLVHTTVYEEWKYIPDPNIIHMNTYSYYWYRAAQGSNEDVCRYCGYICTGRNTLECPCCGAI